MRSVISGLAPYLVRKVSGRICQQPPEYDAVINLTYHCQLAYSGHSPRSTLLVPKEELQ